MPASSAQRISSASASPVIIVPVGLAGEATIRPLSGVTRCCARRLSPVIDQRVASAGFDADRLAAQRRENVPIRRIARQRHRDPIAGVEGCEKGQHEARRRARGDDDALRSDIEPVPLGISARDPPPQRRDAERLGIAVRTVRQRRAHGGDRRRRRPHRRLADLHMDDPAAVRLEPRRGRHDIHHHERRHAAAAGRLDQVSQERVFGLFEHQPDLKFPS